MKNNQSRLLLLTLLLLYLIGRILQLFAGTVPNLIIVAFHVIPPALFAVIHGARIYRTRGIFVFTGLCLDREHSLNIPSGFYLSHAPSQPGCLVEDFEVVTNWASKVSH
jgi:hypothetical protein